MPSASALPRPDFEAIFDAAAGNYLLLAPDLTIIGVNQAYLAATLTTREDIVGRPMFDVFPDDPADHAASGVRNLTASLQRALATKQPDQMPIQRYPIRRPPEKGGGFEERYWSPLNTPVLGPEGEVRCLIHWVEDVTDLMRLREQLATMQVVHAEELRTRAGQVEAEVFLRTEAVEAHRRLLESERRLGFLADAVPQILWSATPDGQLDYCNERWTTVTGLPPDAALGAGWTSALHPDEREQVPAAWAQATRIGTPRHEMQHRFRAPDGTYRWMLSTALSHRDAAGRVQRWYGVTTDLHDRVVAEEQWRQAQRMQAVGKLAGGVSHEINNLMTVVLGFGAFAVRGLAPEHPVRDDLAQMMRAAQRAAAVTRQLLAYSRRQVLQPIVLDLSEVVDSLVPALEQLVGADRRLVIVPSPAPVSVRADRNQLEHILINLVANARDATGTDGEICIGVAHQGIEPTRIASYGETKSEPTEFACITVTDCGVGMDADTVARVFEPFFTTKPVGEGTGLGLSMVYGIVKQHGGYVTVDSSPGQGTRVTVFLPPADTRAEASGPQAASVSIGERSAGGERVLVVEDEPLVRLLTRRALEARGYEVAEAADGEGALAVLAADTNGERGHIDLVLTDVVMPRMTGRELAERLRDEHPDVPVLFISGYTGEDVLRRGLAPTGAPLVQKPFTPEALASAVRAALDGVAPFRTG